MDVVVVIGNNLLDTSRIQEVGNLLQNQVITSGSTKKILHMMSAGPGDRHFIVFFDYYIYSDGDLLSMIKEIDNTAHKNNVNDVEYKSFVPHEKIPELEAQYPQVSFIARSLFFRDLKTYLA